MTCGTSASCGAGNRINVKRLRWSWKQRPDLAGPGRHDVELPFYSKCNGKPMKNFEHNLY